MIWLLVLVIAVETDKIETKILSGFPTIEDCHLAAYTILWDKMPMNQEALCIRTETKRDER
tara:strand:- start:163 stop:345 length:183 start_codon:yes stop_codon:yes gene_type:complete